MLAAILNLYFVLLNLAEKTRRNNVEIMGYLEGHGLVALEGEARALWRGDNRPPSDVF